LAGTAGLRRRAGSPAEAAALPRRWLGYRLFPIALADAGPVEIPVEADLAVHVDLDGIIWRYALDDFLEARPGANGTVHGYSPSLVVRKLVLYQ